MFISRSARQPCLLALVALVAALSLVGVASAHEHRTVGTYELTVGFQNEPAFANQPNAVFLHVVVATPGEGGEEGKPVEGLEKTLKVEVIQGKERTTLPLRPGFGESGIYLADFIPTRAGDYIFHFTGTIADQAVGERFESGPEGQNRFSTVEDPAPLQFPVKQPSASELQASLAEARNQASQARTIGLIGISMGAAGLLAGFSGLVTRRGRNRPAAVTRTEGV